MRSRKTMGGHQDADMMMSRKRLTITQVAVLVASCLQVVQCQSLMNLPDGIENILGFVPKSSFRCERDGYFGDTDNDCKLFHLCQRQVSSNGHVEWRHWTYACGNQTMFNQLTLTCAFVDEAIPCKHASQFQYLNEVIHKPREPFLTDADVTSGFSYYTNRVMSDGARARAFEDSQLLAQLGGSGQSEPQFQGSNLLQSQVSNLQQQVQSNNLHLQRQQFGPASRVDAEADNSASNNVNSVELPLAAAFEALARPQLDQQTPVFVIQQNPSESDSARSNNFGSASQSFFASTGASSPPFAATALERQVNPASLPQPSGQQESSSPAAGSFSFSLSTDHQPGASSSSLFSASQSPFVGPTASLPAPSPTTQPTTAASQPPAATTTTASLPAATRTTESLPVAIRTTESLPAATSQPLAATTTFRQLIPTTSAQPAPFTTTTLASTTSTEARAAPGARAGRQPTLRQQQQLRSSQRLNSMEHGFHSGAFHSTRLSGSQPKPQDTPLLMRRQVAASKPAPRVAPRSAERPKIRQQLHQQQQPVASAGPQAAAASPLVGASSGFWQQSLNSQLLAPKFESLLTRRRV